MACFSSRSRISTAGTNSEETRKATTVPGGFLTWFRCVFAGFFIIIKILFRRRLHIIQSYVSLPDGSLFCEESSTIALVTLCSMITQRVTACFDLFRCFVALPIDETLVAFIISLFFALLFQRENEYRVFCTGGAEKKIGAAKRQKKGKRKRLLLPQYIIHSTIVVRHNAFKYYW